MERPGIDYSGTVHEGVRAMWGLESYVRQSGLEKSLLELVRLRAPQMNGCAYCIDMRAGGSGVNGWNRLAISFRKEPGTYQPESVKTA
jgi:hypothetical protein